MDRETKQRKQQQNVCVCVCVCLCVREGSKTVKAIAENTFRDISQQRCMLTDIVLCVIYLCFLVGSASGKNWSKHWFISINFGMMPTP